MNGHNIGIVGATGAVGLKILKVLDERLKEIKSIRLFASERSAGQKIAFRGRDIAGAVVERSKDDGEVGHPGRLLLELLRRDDLEGGLLVSRVFGGVKLGVGGVSRAFREAAEGALEGLKSA